MGKIAKIKWNNINGGTDRTDLYPITSDRAVYNGDNKTMRELIKVRGVVNISTYFTPDGTPEVLTLSQAVAKITYENRCPGFLATILTSEGWFTFRYSANTIDDTTWSNTDNWIVFHAGRLTVEATSPLHLLLSLKNYVYTLRGYIDAVSESQDGYMTKEDYQKFLQALEDIKNLLSRMTSVEGRLDSAEGRLDSAEGRLDSAEGRLDDAESRLNEADNKFTQINNEISNINVAIASLEENLKNLKIATVVETLPTEDINENTMYLVPDPNAEEGNKFIEYVYVNNAWEKIGEVQLEVDLSDYTKTSELDALLTSWGFIKAADIPDFDAGVTTVVTTNISSEDMQECISLSPVVATDGDVNVRIGLNSGTFKEWLEEKYPILTDEIDTGVTTVKTTVSSDTDEMLNVFTMSPSAARGGDVVINLNVAGDNLKNWVNSFVSPGTTYRYYSEGNQVAYIGGASDDNSRYGRVEVDLEGRVMLQTGNTNTIEHQLALNWEGALTLDNVDVLTKESLTPGTNISISETPEGKLNISYTGGDSSTAGVTSVKTAVTSDINDLRDVFTMTPAEASDGDVTINMNVAGEALRSWINSFVSSGESGVSSVKVTNNSSLDMTDCLMVTPTSAATGDVNVSISLISSAFQNWIENLYPPVLWKTSSLESEPTVNDVSDTEDRYYNVEVTPDNKLVVNVPWYAGEGGGGSNITSVTGSATAPLTLGGQIRNNTLVLTGSVDTATAESLGVVKPYAVARSEMSVNSTTSTSERTYGVIMQPDGTLVVNVPWTEGGDSGANVWVGYGNINITNYAQVNRSQIYPDESYGTPKTGDSILYFYAPDGLRTIILAMINSINNGNPVASRIDAWDVNTGGSSITTVTSSASSPLNLGGSISDNTLNLTGSVNTASANNLGVVMPYFDGDAVALPNSQTTTSGRTYGITGTAGRLTVNVPWTDTTYTAGDGVNISSSNVISVTKGGALPEVNAGEENPTDVYFYNNSLITGSVNKNTTINFHATSGVAGAEVHMILNVSAGVTLSLIGNSAVFTDGYTTLNIATAQYVEINAVFDGSTIYVRSSYTED